MVRNGDVKAIQPINMHPPYGPEAEVCKEECVGHVAKRMHTSLTALHNRATHEDGRTFSLKGGCGGLTDQILQVPYCYYYKRVLILANIGDLVITAKFCARY